MNAKDTQLSFSLKGASDASSLSVRKLWDEIQKGKLKSVLKGRRRLILRADLERYLKS